jgi:hypothetical protein
MTNPAQLVAVTACAFLAGCVSQSLPRHPIVKDSFTVTCPKSQVTVTNPTDWMAHQIFSCDKNGFVTQEDPKS